MLPSAYFGINASRILNTGLCTSQSNRVYLYTVETIRVVKQHTHTHQFMQLPIRLTNCSVWDRMSLFPLVTLMKNITLCIRLGDDARRATERKIRVCR